MNILVIGNGFDLAHGLPTKYTDFLFFCGSVKKLIKHSGIADKIPKNYKSLCYFEWINKDEKISFLNTKLYNATYKTYLHFKKYEVSYVDEKVYEKMLDKFIKKCFFEQGIDKKLVKEIIFLVYDNFWIEYFLRCNMHGDKNWIDFELEISNVIKSLDNNMHGLDYNYDIFDKIDNLPNTFLDQYFIRKKNQKVTYKVIRDRLEIDLNKLIRVFEIYLTEYVEKIEPISQGFNLDEFNVNKVLSFNYTDTYEKVYDITNVIEYDYTHGKADSRNTMDSNNMVIGINEYLSEDRINKDVEFVAFKKYYQRIHKQTGCKYKDWMDQIKEEWENETEEIRAEIRTCISKGNSNNPKIHRLYILGHSLDVTDKDILCDLILNDNVYTTIYYQNKEELGRKIANLVKVIGQDELIRRTGGSTKTINFVAQKDIEVEIEGLIFNLF